MEHGVIDLSSRRELFVDYELIDRLLQARLKLHESRPEEVAIRRDGACPGHNRERPAHSASEPCRRRFRTADFVYKASHRGDERKPDAAPRSLSLTTALLLGVADVPEGESRRLGPEGSPVQSGHRSASD